MTVKLPPFPVLLILAVGLAVAFVPLPGGGGGVVSPVTDKGFKVLVVEETAELQNLPPGQREAIMSEAPGSLKAYAKTNGEWRRLDKDSDPSKDLPWVREAMSLAKPPYPWLFVAKDGRASVGPLPTEIGETMAIAKRYGGK